MLGRNEKNAVLVGRKIHRTEVIGKPIGHRAVTGRGQRQGHRLHDAGTVKDFNRHPACPRVGKRDQRPDTQWNSSRRRESPDGTPGVVADVDPDISAPVAGRRRLTRRVADRCSGTQRTDTESGPDNDVANRAADARTDARSSADQRHQSAHHRPLSRKTLLHPVEIFAERQVLGRKKTGRPAVNCSRVKHSHNPLKTVEALHRPCNHAPIGIMRRTQPDAGQ